MNTETIDVTNPNEALQRIRTLNVGLSYGFDAIGMDYNFYIESTLGSAGKHPIYELRDNVRYRFNSSEFHLYLLLQHQIFLSNHFATMLKQDSKVFDGFLTGNPYFEKGGDEVMAIYDSVIFHLSSAFDYLSMLLNYLFGADKNAKIKWLSLVKSCSPNSNNEMNTKKISSTIVAVHQDFIANFNNYRTELIHRESSSSFASITWTPASSKVNATFICSEKLKKEFRKIIDPKKTYTISHLTFRLIEEGLLQISKVLNSIRIEFNQRDKMANNIINETAMYSAIIDPKTGKQTSPSDGYWFKFDEIFNPQNI